mmetsp:Transcript_20624/g.28821  ORF Transcript_20624/g.28821 Transcript_20624/m.28821 type:complete len:147 (+) Transcript_20624:192-632(+)|eukprot:CAMPEP_0184480272 /NCGR_PEP_ID=MMETSP0113_2-20130426/1769_1 /TAXON_ID=91329 /ORGANISM="Norrisiella sphaerica, Strain BC52" /LENGTH=146 /DNA_ID=CAMNT_0026858647 /DNA_START=192 /DNA_END=632 /DNA_ORIENTATION=-
MGMCLSGGDERNRSYEVISDPTKRPERGILKNARQPVKTEILQEPTVEGGTGSNTSKSNKDSGRNSTVGTMSPQHSDTGLAKFAADAPVLSARVPLAQKKRVGFDENNLKKTRFKIKRIPSILGMFGLGSSGHITSSSNLEIKAEA